jgi:1,4-dihydroxy-6-naphthoate synthase
MPGAKHLFLKGASVMIRLGISPCPNDTFMFHDLATGRLAPVGAEVKTEFHDVETLNTMALRGELDICKVSFATWLAIRDQYDLLTCGAAIGFGCGPVLVCQEPLPNREALAGQVITTPGANTTGTLLLRMWAPPDVTLRHTTYDRVAGEVLAGRTWGGLLIHEGRFTFTDLGLHLVEDLGKWWQDQTQLPIPLGGIVAHRRLGADRIAEFDGLLRQSIHNAEADPDSRMPWIRQFAQEMDEQVLRKHIKTFVNEFSLDMGPLGRRAIDVLADRADRLEDLA